MASIDIEIEHEALDFLHSRGFYKGKKTIFKILAGGVSNRTILVKSDDDAGIVVKQALEKLRVKADWFSDPSRIHREAIGLRLFEKILPSGSSTPFLFEDHQDHILGMEAVPAPHENWKDLLLAGKVKLDHFRQFACILAKMHQYGFGNPLEKELYDVSFFETLRLEPYYQYSASQVPGAANFLSHLVQQTRENRFTIVHGDFSPKNILIYQNRLILLDHEVIHYGDAAFDVGFSMAHFISKTRHLPEHRQNFIGATLEYWKSYCSQVQESPWFDGFEARAMQHTLGCLLARVAGRSPLEYLSPQERENQSRQVLKWITNPPRNLEDLILNSTDA